MRRALVGLLSVAAVVVAAQAGVASSSAAPPAGAAIVCPLEPAGTIPCCGLVPAGTTVPCCGGPIPVRPVCCHLPIATVRCPPPPPPPPPPPTTPTIASTPNPSTAGMHVTISGKARGTVALWQELPGSRSFREVATTTPDAAGAYTFVRGPETNVKWYVVAGGRRSKVVSQRVAAVVTITAPVRTARAGRVVRFTGHVTPDHAGQRLMLEKRVRGGWRTIASTKIDGASRYVVRTVVAVRGRARFRAVLPGDSRNVRSVSPVLTLVT